MWFAGKETGVITIDQFAALMSQFNLNLKTSILQSLLLALGLDETTVTVHKKVPYHAFVRAIMPMDYPRPGRFVTSIVDRARGPMDEDPGMALVREMLAAQSAAAVGECVDGTTADGFENALRAKLQARVHTGPTEVLSQFRLFDKDKKGWISSEEFVKGCASFNLYPSAEVLGQIVSKYFDAQGKISFAVFVTSIIGAFDFANARLGDPACSSLLASKLGGDASANLWAMVRDAGPVDTLSKEELAELCLDAGANMPLAGDELQQLLDSCPTHDGGRIGLRSFGSAVASALLASDRIDAKEQLWDLLSATGLPGMGLPWSHGIDRNRAFDSSIKAPCSDAAAASLFKAAEYSDEEVTEHPVEDSGIVRMRGSFDAVQPIEKWGIQVAPTRVMADKFAQKTEGQTQHSDLPKMYYKFANGSMSMTKDEFAAFLQEGLNTNLGKDDVEELVNELRPVDSEAATIDIRRIAALVHSSDYPKTDGKYRGVLTLTHPADAIAQKPAPWKPRAPDSLAKDAPIDLVNGLVSKAKQKTVGAKSAEGAELLTLLAAFKHFDVAKNGTLTVKQIEQVLTRQGLPASQTSRLLDALGESGQEEINYRSLCNKVCGFSQTCVRVHS